MYHSRAEYLNFQQEENLLKIAETPLLKMHMCTCTTANVDHILVAGITLCFSGSVTQKMFEKTETIGCTKGTECLYGKYYIYKKRPDALNEQNNPHEIKMSI